jgi:hypothetical protein
MDKQCLVKKPLVNICKKHTKKHRCCSSDSSSDEHIIGPTGPTGPTGPAGSALSFANFYALMPTNNPDQLYSGDSIAFPNTNIISGTDISRSNSTEFILESIGNYQVYFVFTINQRGQVGVSLNSTILPNSIVGIENIGQLSGKFIISVTSISSVLSIKLTGNRDPIDPAQADVSFTLIKYAGMSNKIISPVSAQLIITRLS